jgi:hypothetical protein
MQQCGDCLKIYDESEDSKCPFCFEDDDDYTHVVVFDRSKGEAVVVPKDEAHLYE